MWDNSCYHFKGWNSPKFILNQGLPKIVSIQPDCRASYINSACQRSSCLSGGMDSWSFFLCLILRQYSPSLLSWPSLFHYKTCINLLMFFKDFIYLFLERGEGNRGRERERHQCLITSHTPPTWPATQAHALSGNRTSDPLICRPALNPLSHTSQGCLLMFCL